MRLNKAICERCCREKTGEFWEPDGYAERFEHDWNTERRVMCLVWAARVSMQTMKGRITQVDDAKPPGWCPYQTEHVVSQ